MLISHIEYYQMQCLIRFSKKKKRRTKKQTDKQTNKIIQLQ